jgi:hypothetical protein
MELKKRWVCRCFIIIACLVIVAACASTKVSTTWKNEQFQAKFGKVFVIAVMERDLLRGYMENEFLDRMKARGVEGLASHKFFSVDQMKDRAAVVAKLRELGMESVLVMRPISRGEVDRLYPGGVYLVPTNLSYGWHGYYTDSYAAVVTPGYGYSADIFTIETRIFDVKSETLRWSAVTQTRVEGAKEKAVQPLVDALVTALVSDKLL